MSAPLPVNRPTLGAVKLSIGRELGMRRSVYPKSSRMSKEEQAHEISCMEEAYRLVSLFSGLRAKLLASKALRAVAVEQSQGGDPEAFLAALVSDIIEAMKSEK